MWLNVLWLKSNIGSVESGLKSFWLTSRPVILGLSLAASTAACSKARLTSTDASPVPQATVDSPRPAVVTAEVTRPVGGIQIRERESSYRDEDGSGVQVTVTQTEVRSSNPGSITVPYDDVNSRLSPRTVYDCTNDCPPASAPAPAPTAPAPAAPTPAAPAPAAPAPAPTPAPQPALVEQCTFDEFYQPDPQKIDILVVVDTAGPIFDETDLLAKALSAYVDQHTLRERHVRLAMIPAHGSRSPYSGKVYQPIPDGMNHLTDDELDDFAGDLSEEAYSFFNTPREAATNPLVMDSLELELTNNNFEWFARTNALFMVRDEYSDGGQSGLLSLYKALTDNFSELKSHNLFREDATQHILFISNEADICANSNLSRTAESSRKLKDSEMPSLTKEQAAYIRDCEETGFHQGLLVQRISELQNDYALTVSSIVPTDPNTFRALHPFNSEETEMGAGYIEVAEATGGYVYDLFDVRANSLDRFATSLARQFEQGLTDAYLPRDFTVAYDGTLTSLRAFVMDAVYDEVYLRQLGQHCIDRTHYDPDCFNMRETDYVALSILTRYDDGRAGETVRLSDSGKFGSKIQFEVCTATPTY